MMMMMMMVVDKTSIVVIVMKIYEKGEKYDVGVSLKKNSRNKGKEL